MDIKNKKIKELRAVESIINRNLYVLCGILTVITMTVIFVDFFSKGKFSNFKIDIFYLGVLLIYSAHKELIRLMGKKNFWHHGEYFVYAWVIITIALYLINFLTRGYYTYSPEGQQNTILIDTSLLALQVMVVFIISRTFKIARASYESRKK